MVCLVTILVGEVDEVVLVKLVFKIVRDSDQVVELGWLTLVFRLPDHLLECLQCFVLA